MWVQLIALNLLYIEQIQTDIERIQTDMDNIREILLIQIQMT